MQEFRICLIQQTKSGGILLKERERNERDFMDEFPPLIPNRVGQMGQIPPKPTCLKLNGSNGSDLNGVDGSSE